MQFCLKNLREKESISSHAREVKRVGLRVAGYTVCWYIKNTRRHVIKSVLCERSRGFAGKERKSVLCASGNRICNFASLVFIVIKKQIKRNFNISLQIGPGIRSDIHNSWMWWGECRSLKLLPLYPNRSKKNLFSSYKLSVSWVERGCFSNTENSLHRPWNVEIIDRKSFNLSRKISTL
jgi:hypothetical protein